MKCAGDAPKLFGAAGGGVNHLRVAAGQRFILFIANQENRKRARGDRFHRGNLRKWNAGEFFSAVEQRPGAGSEKRFAEQWGFAQAGVVVSGFAQIGEGRFGDHRFDTRIGARRLQGDARAHGFAEREDMPRRMAW
jgi:hypothetical protein